MEQLQILPLPWQKMLILPQILPAAAIGRRFHALRLNVSSQQAFPYTARVLNDQLKTDLRWSCR